MTTVLKVSTNKPHLIVHVLVSLTGAVTVGIYATGDWFHIRHWWRFLSLYQYLSLHPSPSPSMYVNYLPVLLPGLTWSASVLHVAAASHPIKLHVLCRL